MNKRLPNQWLVVCILMLGSSLWLTSCAPQGAITKSPLPTPQQAIAGSPLPTPSGEAWGFLVTPLPGEKVRVGEVTEVVETKTVVTPAPPRYSIQTEHRGQVDALFVHDSKTGQDLRLGDDQGDTRLEAMTDQYIIWRHIQYGHDKDAVQTGLYARVMSTGDQIVIAQEPGFPWESKIDGEWVSYLFPEKGDIYFTQLRAHNLSTDEDFLIGQHVPYNRPGQYFAISDSQIAWVEVETGATSAKWMIRVYDLTTRTARTLNVPEVVSPVDLSLSGDIAVWWDRFWRGYDLKQDITFTIPIIPPGWESMPVQPAGGVTVVNDRLYWELKVKDKVYKLTAPIIRDK